MSALVRRAEAVYRAAEALGCEVTATGFGHPDDPDVQHLLSEVNAATRGLLLLTRALANHVGDAEQRAAAEAGQ